MYWHITIAADERLTVFPTPPQRRRAVRALVRTVGAAALLYFVADDHLHVVISGTRADAGRYAQALALALRRCASVELDRSVFRVTVLPLTVKVFAVPLKSAFRLSVLA